MFQRNLFELIEFAYNETNKNEKVLSQNFNRRKNRLYDALGWVHMN